MTPWPESMHQALPTVAHSGWRLALALKGFASKQILFPKRDCIQSALPSSRNRQPSVRYSIQAFLDKRNNHSARKTKRICFELIQSLVGPCKACWGMCVLIRDNDWVAKADPDSLIQTGAGIQHSKEVDTALLSSDTNHPYILVITLLFACFGDEALQWIAYCHNIFCLNSTKVRNIPLHILQLCRPKCQDSAAKKKRDARQKYLPVSSNCNTALLAFKAFSVQLQINTTVAQTQNSTTKSMCIDILFFNWNLASKSSTLLLKHAGKLTTS